MASGASGQVRGNSADQLTSPIRGGRATTRAATPHVVETSIASLIRFPLFVGFLHLIIVQVAASLAYRFGTSTTASPPYRTLPPPHTGLGHTLVDPFRQWDGLWYRLIAIEGYEKHQANAAFWPLFPWMMRGLGHFTGISYDTAGYIIANVAFVIALVLLYRLVLLDFDIGTAQATIWAIALFPTAFFFSAVYTEAPFLLFLVGALLAARLRMWWLAGIIGALAALTRSYGVFLVLPFAVLFVQQYGFAPRRWIPRGITVAMPLLGPAIFSWRLNQLWSNPWAWKDVQEQWNRYSAKPWETMHYAFSSSPAGRAIGVQDGADWGWIRDLMNHPTWGTVTSQSWRMRVANSDTLELVSTLLFVALMLIGLFKLPLYQSVYLVPGLVVPLFQPSSVHVLMSMPRFGLTLFPLFVVIGILLRGRKIAIPLALISTAMLVLLTIQFSQWYWVS